MLKQLKKLPLFDFPTFRIVIPMGGRKAICLVFRRMLNCYLFLFQSLSIFGIPIPSIPISLREALPTIG
jgi:hypothetical protein